MIAARIREREYFASIPEYKHLAHRMGSEHLATMLSKVCRILLCTNTILFNYLSWWPHDNLLVIVLQHLESVIKSRIPGIQSLITKATAELETELCRLGKPIAADAGVRLLHVISLRIDDFIFWIFLYPQSFSHSICT